MNVPRMGVVDDQEVEQRLPLLRRALVHISSSLLGRNDSDVHLLEGLDEV